MMVELNGKRPFPLGHADLSDQSVPEIDVQHTIIGVVITPLYRQLNRESAPTLLAVAISLANTYADQEIILDLHRVEAMDSAGLSVLIRLFKLMLPRKQALIITGVCGKVQEMFRITLLDQIVKPQSYLGTAPSHRLQ